METQRKGTSFNYYTVTAVGATLAMALAVFGQSLVGLIFDLTGLFDMEKKRITGEKWCSLANVTKLSRKRGCWGVER